MAVTPEVPERPALDEGQRERPAPDNAPHALPPRPHVVVVGGGFGGLAVVRSLRDEDFDVTLIDRENYHLFQPLLYQVATGALSPANIASPLRRIVRHQRNVRVLNAEVVTVDPQQRRVFLADGGPLDYDHLVVAAGAETHWFGHADWAEAARGLKSIPDATAHRARILRAFEAAELLDSRDPDEGALTFVVVGAGPTGVETAGAIAELARDTLRHDFRRIDPTRASVVLVEMSDQILPSYPPSLARRAERALQRLGVQVMLRASVTAIDPRGVSVRTVDGATVYLPSSNVIWAAGVRPVSLARTLATVAGIELTRDGRVPVGPDLSVEGCPDLFVIGDMAAVPSPGGGLLPGVAPVAIQEGEYVARALVRRRVGETPGPFRFNDPGRMATVGRGYAVFERGPVKLTGFLGWAGWLGIHLLQIAEFENRVLVAFQWAWSYLTRNRSARLIVRPRNDDD